MNSTPITAPCCGAKHPATELAATEHPATEHPATEHPATELAATGLAATELAATGLAATELAAARHPSTGCPVEATISLIGGKYKSLILWKLMSGTLRFSQLRREVPGATPKMLTQQLRELEADGLLAREVFPVVPPKVEYSLTPFGKSIAPVLQAMYSWGSGYLHKQGLAVNCTMEPFSI